MGDRNTFDPQVVCKHEWFVVRWEYEYPGRNSLRPAFQRAREIFCPKCKKVEEVSIHD